MRLLIVFIMGEPTRPRGRRKGGPTGCTGAGAEDAVITIRSTCNMGLWSPCGRRTISTGANHFEFTDMRVQPPGKGNTSSSCLKRRSLLSLPMTGEDTIATTKERHPLCSLSNPWRNRHAASQQPYHPQRVYCEAPTRERLSTRLGIINPKTIQSRSAQRYRQPSTVH
jgi:hypothetical protein